MFFPNPRKFYCRAYILLCSLRYCIFYPLSIYIYIDMQVSFQAMTMSYRLIYWDFGGNVIDRDIWNNSDVYGKIPQLN